jgi:hypothetical protein
VVFLVLVILLAVAAAAWVVFIRSRPQRDDDHPPTTPASSDEAAPVQEATTPPGRTPRTPITRLELTEEQITDLRALGGARLRIVGTAHWVPNSRRTTVGGDAYVLVREPKNEHDENAVAVYDATRKVGYLSRAKAAAYALQFDRIGAPGYRVAGEPPKESVKLWIVLPPIAAVRALQAVDDTGSIDDRALSDHGDHRATDPPRSGPC